MIWLMVVSAQEILFASYANSDKLFRFGNAGAKWDLIWVPLAPLVCCCMCCYVTASLEYTAQEVRKLSSLRYRHKGL